MEGPDEDAVENGLAVLEIQCMSGTSQCMSHAIIRELALRPPPPSKLHADVSGQ